MKKFGFTLAEVLITLAVIGVIARVTLPALQTNVQKHQVGPALAKAINSLENANQLALQQTGARTLDQIPLSSGASNTNYFENAIKDILTYTKVNRTQTYRSSDFKTLVAAVNNKAYGYQTKDGIMYFRAPDPTTPRSLGSTGHLPPTYAGKYYIVYVDINGQGKKPNALGKDLFLLWVDLKGSVIPYGGTAYKAYTNSSSVLWESGCKKNITNADACAGSIADNGYKVIYNY